MQDYLFFAIEMMNKFFCVFNEIEDNINCVYANICLVQFIDTPQISVFRGDQQISLKVRTNIIRATSFVTLQRSIIETNRYWSAFETENQHPCLHLCGLISIYNLLCVNRFNRYSRGRNEILLCKLRCGLDKIVQCKWGL